MSEDTMHNARSNQCNAAKQAASAPASTRKVLDELHRSNCDGQVRHYAVFFNSLLGISTCLTFEPIDVWPSI
jgi:hypothetical protein